MRPVGVVVTAAVVAGVFAWSERVHCRASTRRLGDRVRVALRSIDPHASESVLAFFGGAVGSSAPRTTDSASARS